MLNSLPQPMGTVMREVDRFTHERRAQLGTVNDAHWRRGGGTFDYFCPERRVESWRDDGRAARIQTVARLVVGLAAQIVVSSVDGVLAGYWAGILLVVGRKEACREVLAQHYWPVFFTLVVAQIALCVAAMVGATVLLRRAL